MGSGGNRSYRRKISQGDSLSSSRSREISKGGAQASGTASSSIDCRRLDLTTDLQNIQDSIKDYNEGDILNVELDVLDNVCVTGEFGIIGYVTSILAVKLIDCINKGISYEAVILKIYKTSCTVIIRVID